MASSHSMDKHLQQEILYRLGSLRQSSDAWDPSDDWTGITNSAERKKRQNRLNQRTYRRKRNAQIKELQKLPKIAHAATVPVSPEHCAKEGKGSALNNLESALVVRETEATLYDGPVLLTCPRRIARIRQLLRLAHEEYSLRTPRPTNLPILIRLNVLNALARNAILMGFPPEGLCSEDMISPYNEAGPNPSNLPKPLSSCPDTLTPTALQLEVRHHPWIDLFPFPKLRDNMLLAMNAGILNEDDLCMDLLHVEAEDLGTKPALMVWGESWDIRGWEANLSFLQKWGWLVSGCPEIIEGSNYWRRKRGERKFVLQTS